MYSIRRSTFRMYTRAAVNGASAATVPDRDAVSGIWTAPEAPPGAAPGVPFAASTIIAAASRRVIKAVLMTVLQPAVDAATIGAVRRRCPPSYPCLRPRTPSQTHDVRSRMSPGDRVRIWSLHPKYLDTAISSRGSAPATIICHPETIVP